MLPTEKCCVLPTENRNCLSLPTKEGFFEKAPAEGRKGLGLPIYEIKPCIIGHVALSPSGKYIAIQMLSNFTQHIKFLTHYIIVLQFLDKI